MTVELPAATKLALDRTRLAYERTLMAWVRTATSLISFGFTIYKFFQFLREGQQPSGEGMIGLRSFAMLMIGIGLTALLLATIQHRRDRLGLQAEYGIAAAVVSMPCWELFEEQSAAYRKEVLGIAPRIAIEAAARHGWDRWIGDNGAFIGMTGFGASAPAPDLYRHFNITPDAVVEAARKLI